MAVVIKNFMVVAVVMTITQPPPPPSPSLTTTTSIQKMSTDAWPTEEDVKKYGQIFFDLASGLSSIRCWALPMVVASPVIRKMIDGVDGDSKEPFPTDGGKIKVDGLTLLQLWYLRDILYHLTFKKRDPPTNKIFDSVSENQKAEAIWVAKSYFHVDTSGRNVISIPYDHKVFGWIVMAKLDNSIKRDDVPGAIFSFLWWLHEQGRVERSDEIYGLCVETKEIKRKRESATIDQIDDDRPKCSCGMHHDHDDSDNDDDSDNSNNIDHYVR